MTSKSGHTPWDDALARVDPARFEQLLADYYRGCGWNVEQVGADFTGQRYDAGFDLQLRREDAYVIVQCKRWKAFKVPHHEVHELHAIMVNEAATGAIYVTSGEFTEAAVEAARRSGHVELVDGDTLRTMLDPAVLESVARDSPPPMYAHPQLTLSGGARVPSAPRRSLMVPVLALAACVVVCAGVVHSLNAMVRPAPRLTATRGAQIPPTPGESAARRSVPSTDPYSLAGRPMPASRTPPDAGAADPIAHAGAAPERSRSIDREAARTAVRPLRGVHDVFWLDDNDLVVVVERGARADDMIATVCRALAPLGDSASIIVDLQQATSRRSVEPLASSACSASTARSVAAPVAGLASDAASAMH